ncbi:hypothetical protein BKA83DRAFT_2075603 [Pisolithus microcarpus]|nr:hypothetical protein BKA83DRAFT_2075603 [Pisolithus microcarpus]
MPRQQATWKAAVTRCLLFRDLYIRSATIGVRVSQGRSLRGDVIFLGVEATYQEWPPGRYSDMPPCAATSSLTGVICEPVTCTTVHVHTPDLPGNGYSARSKYKRPNFTPITITDSGEIGPRGEAHGTAKIVRRDAAYLISVPFLLVHVSSETIPWLCQWLAPLTAARSGRLAATSQEKDFSLTTRFPDYKSVY